MYLTTVKSSRLLKKANEPRQKTRQQETSSLSNPTSTATQRMSRIKTTTLPVLLKPPCARSSLQTRCKQRLLRGRDRLKSRAIAVRRAKGASRYRNNHLIASQESEAIARGQTHLVLRRTVSPTAVKEKMQREVQQITLRPGSKKIRMKFLAQ